MDWQPSASIEVLRQRAALLNQIRVFFQQRSVLEVDTPALSMGTVTDLYLDPLQTQHPMPGSAQPVPLYLQTSPEYAMKRLLAAGAPDIFQIAKCFREDEIGRLHNPEFLLLEWYRLGFSMQALIDEVGQLLIEVLNGDAIEQLTYQEAFLKYLNFDPLRLSLRELIEHAESFALHDYIKQIQGYDDKSLFDSLLQVLFAQHIESKIGQNMPACITHFPASQAALAKLSPDNQTALRFEFYYRGVELANGFEELTDADAQLSRFEQDNKQRARLGKAQRPIDKRFIAALRAGLPPCAGVALGLDRLLMLTLGANALSEVIPFDITRA